MNDNHSWEYPTSPPKFNQLIKSSRCAQCRLSEADVTLRLCARCKSAKYCSKECQAAHYPVHKKGCYHSAKYLESLERSERTGAVDNLLPPGISLSELNTCFDKWNKYHNPTLCAALIRALDLPRDINRSRTHILKINIEARTDPEVHDAGKYFHVVDAEVLDAAVARTLPGWAVPMEELDTLRADSEQKGWGAFIGVALQCPALGLVFATFTSISQRDIKYFKLRALPDWKDRLISDVEKGRRRSVLDNT